MLTTKANYFYNSWYYLKNHTKRIISYDVIYGVHIMPAGLHYQFLLKSSLKIVFCCAPADNIGNVMITSLCSVVSHMEHKAFFYFNSATITFICAQKGLILFLLSIFIFPTRVFALQKLFTFTVYPIRDTEIRTNKYDLYFNQNTYRCAKLTRNFRNKNAVFLWQVKFYFYLWMQVNNITEKNQTIFFRNMYI